MQRLSVCSSAGDTPLLFAAARGQMGAVVILAKVGADVHPSADQALRLHHTLRRAFFFQSFFLSFLFFQVPPDDAQAGADVSVRNAAQLSPLQMAAAGGHPDCVRLLLRLAGDAASQQVTHF